MRILNLKTEKRPWGEFRTFVANENVTVKTIFVRKGESLSLQCHNNRSEFWRVLSGSPEITIGALIVRAKKDDEFEIPKKTNHRIRAVNDDAEFLEISRGKFSEEDIVRIEDKYGRV